MTFRLLLILAAILSASCSKLPESQVSFHSQTPPGEHESMVFGFKYKGEVKYFRRIPEFAKTNIEEYQPFSGRDGRSFGAVFFLKETPRNRLANFSVENRGNYLLHMINGNVGDEPILIDKPVNDGVLVVWKGLTLSDLQMLDADIRRKGDSDDEWKARQKSAKAALKAEQKKKG